MHKLAKASQRLILAVIVTAFVAGGALAEKPEWAGANKHAKEGQGGKPDKEPKQDRGRDAGARAGAMTFAFGGDERRMVDDYYGARFRTGKCPPGLAKKNNGCLPPGQAKKWAKGQPLPKDLRFYDLPRELRIRLPAPPPNHRYVRVAADILLIAVGSQMVIDAIEDIGR